MGHLVVRATQLEAKDRLLILALEQHLAIQAVAEADCMSQRSFIANFPHTGI